MIKTIENLKTNVLNFLKQYHQEYTILNAEAIRINFESPWPNIFTKYIDKKNESGYEPSNNNNTLDIDTCFINFTTKLLINSYSSCIYDVKDNSLKQNIINSIKDNSLDFIYNLNFDKNNTNLNNIKFKNLLFISNVLNRFTETHPFIYNYISKKYVSSYFNESSYFEKACQTSLFNGIDQILFHAYTSYISFYNEENDNDIDNWMRIFHNLWVNSEQNFDNKILALNTITKLLPYRNNILGYLTENYLNDEDENWLTSQTDGLSTPQLLGFNPFQIREEAIKAWLFLESPGSWQSAVEEAEGQDSLEGTLASVLEFSGVVERRDSKLNLLSNNNLLESLDVFKSYLEKLKVKNLN
ncbi:MAG: hypothetical protein LBV23_09080 [Deltaproteobacteria bacterium]|jgi:hypothetical protein|nr:hypothetical protein [Deltaproteobacteria bacterium]